MTNLKAVNVGMNKYSGPAVLSILTGRSTDECARVISSVNGKYRIEGVELPHLLRAADILGFANKKVEPANTLFGTLMKLVNDDGMYIVTVTGHFVAIEVKDSKIYFCDNHTKEPMPAASSARMMQRVLAVHKVIKRAPPKLISTSIFYTLSVTKHFNYDNADYNKIQRVIPQTFDSLEGLRHYVNEMSEVDSDE